jgi:hypothetical protein
MSLSSNLYRAARVSRNIEAVSGGPDKAVRRARNVATGRTLRRLGVWGRLWGGR